MSYRCGIEQPLAGMMGVDAGGPRFTCDECGVRYNLPTNKLPGEWFFSGKPPRGWRTRKDADGKRFDWCPRCKVQP